MRGVPPTRVAVAASNALAAAAGVRLADAGGNAIDAGLAAALVSMVCEPGICAVAGGAFVTIAPPDGSAPVTVDGNVEMPGRGLPPERLGRGRREVTTDYGGGVTMTIGHGSVATPGAVAALDLAHRRYGRAPWREVVAPACEAARDGFPLGAASAYYLRYAGVSVFGWHPDSRAPLLHDDGRPLEQGETVHVAGLADSLAAIGSEGAQTFYRGDLAARIAADMRANDGVLTAEDLAAYEPLVRPALGVRLGRWQLWTNPPPSIGGTTLAAMLHLLDGRPRGATWTPDDVAHVAAVQEAVLRYRLDVLDVADDRAAVARALLDRVGAGEGVAAVRGSAATIHVSAVDADGGACAVTASAGYGSGVVTPGTGLWLNNCLGEPELNRRTMAPGERLPTNMAPTVGRSDDGAVLAIGSPGADRITTALMQVLAAMANGGASLQDAIAHPRLHVRVLPGGDAVVEHEADLVLPPVPWPTREHHAQSMYFGGAGAALRTPDADLVAAGDPRRAAVVAVGP
jgi:gamma-glutamyltranspeptidase/glutathione hydrolase